MKTIDVLQIGSELYAFINYVQQNESDYERIDIGVLENLNDIPLIKPTGDPHPKFRIFMFHDNAVNKGEVYFVVRSITRMEWVEEEQVIKPVERPYIWTEYTPQAPETSHGVIHQTLKARLRVIREDYIRRFKVG